MASFYPSGTHLTGEITLTGEDLRAIDAVASGTYTPAAAITITSGNGFRFSADTLVGADGSGMRPAPPPRDECGHCGCPFPESPCHYCGTKTRRER